MLKGIRETGDEGFVQKHDEGSSNIEDNPVDLKEKAEDMNFEESTYTDVEPCERSASRLSAASDITLAIEDTTEDNTEEQEEDVSDNTLEEISAL